MSSQQDLTSPGVIFWFRNDLRLHDQLALRQAVAYAQQTGAWLLPVYVHDSALLAQTQWGFTRTQTHRQTWIRMALNELAQRLKKLGSQLIELEGNPPESLSKLSEHLKQPVLFCEEIAAPDEQEQVRRLSLAGVTVRTVWQSTLIAPEQLPFPPQAVPDHFTPFRQLLEKHGIQAHAPIDTIHHLPPLPGPSSLTNALEGVSFTRSPGMTTMPPTDTRSALPWTNPDFHGGESAALTHLEQYCRRGLPHTYKTTRNQLIGMDYSTKWSPWLATGALSPRQAWSAIQTFETEYGANESTYWIGFELLWRDHFRWLHHKHGACLYQARGLTRLPPPAHDPAAFKAWCQGQTGQVFIDSGMRELAATGYLSNRLRQNVASYLIHDLQCDWRAGAAWFEAQLIDYDVYSNQGNWLYLSGRGTDPRGSRRFNPVKQAQDYDPEESYRSLWNASRR